MRPFSKNLTQHWWTALMIVAMTAAPAQAYQNPILTGIRDPDASLLNGVYHMIEPEGHTDNGGYYAERSSKDLLHWSAPTAILQQAPGFFLWQGHFYAAQDGQIYLYYTEVDTTKRRIVKVASAKSPTGPFTTLGTIADNGIDPYPFQDADGTLWLYYKNDLKSDRGIWVQRMASPSKPAAQPPVEVLKPQPGTFEDTGMVTVEGPTVIFQNGNYFLIYTGGAGNLYNYAVGYAVARHPTGPFVRGPNNPILANSKSPNVFSPGVPSVVPDGSGTLWLIYRQRATADNDSPRQLTIDPLDVSRAAQGILSATATNGVTLPDPVPLR